MPDMIENAGLAASQNPAVNVVGWVRAENGIGEDARVAHQALHLAEIEAVMIDAAKRVPPPQAKLRDKSELPPISDAFVHPVDLVYLDAATQFRYHAHGLLHNEKSKSRANILVSPWELPVWPEALGYIFDHVDEFWAASEYIFRAFAPHFVQKSIQLAPPAVVVPENELDDFSIADVHRNLVFLTVFDGASSMDRKNPLAVAKAFLQAFPKQKNEDVSLVIKTMNFDTGNAELRGLTDIVAKDGRIRLVNAALSKDELYALIRTCHCFVSLHRAEGLGRNIAEHMLFNRPVIVSNFSGNLDFCKKDTAYLTDGDFVPVGNSYWYNQGQSWFDASIEHAAEHMRRVYEDRTEAAVIAAKGRELIRREYSLVATGMRYRTLLEDFAARKGNW